MKNKKKEEILRYLAVIERASARVKELLNEEDGGLFEKLLQEPSIPMVREEGPAKLVRTPLKMSDIQEAKPLPKPKSRPKREVLDINNWPEAIPVYLEKPSDEDQTKRAIMVLDKILDQSMEDKNFLDYGCGEGWVTQQAVYRGAKKVVGYDIVSHHTWSKFKGAVFTNNLQTEKELFDVVFLYDVLDHCEDPIGVMEDIKSRLSTNGKVYVRCHPWTSRHGMHLFKIGLNKAYLHLFLNWDELVQASGQQPWFTRPEKNPIEAYHWWFHQFRIVKEVPIKDLVPDFFKNQKMKELIAERQQMPFEDVNQFLDLMEVSFVDYVLTLQ